MGGGCIVREWGWQVLVKDNKYSFLPILTLEVNKKHLKYWEPYFFVKQPVMFATEEIKTTERS